MNVRGFIFGPMHSMEKPAYSWWSSKRREYNIKLLLCLLAAQLLFALLAIGSMNNSDIDIWRRIFGALMADLLIILLINIVYFIWPTLEVILFKKINIIYRKYCFAFLNIVSVLIFVSALVIVFTAKI